MSKSTSLTKEKDVKDEKEKSRTSKKSRRSRSSLHHKRRSSHRSRSRHRTSNSRHRHRKERRSSKTDRKLKGSRSRLRSPSHKEDLPRRSSLWDQTPTEAQMQSSNVNKLKGLLVKMPDGTFANAQTLLGASNLGTGFQSKVSPGTLNTSTDVLNLKKQAKRLYASNLSEDTDSESLKRFLNEKMKETKGAEKDTVISVFVHKIDRSAYIEFVDETCATFALSLNGTSFRGKNLNLERPTGYISSTASDNLAAASEMRRLELSGATSKFVPDGAGKVFCSGLPCELGDEEVVELVSTYGNLSNFFLPKDPATSQSRGYCFFIYEDLSVTNDAVKGLNGIQIGDKTLTVKLHSQSNKEDPVQALKKAQQVLIATAASDRIDKPSRVLCMLEMVTEEDLYDDKEYDEILDDIRSECENYGKVVSIKIPRPNYDQKGVGKVFVKFGTVEEARSAKGSLEGRTFDKRTVFVKYFDEKKFNFKEYDTM